MHERSVVLSPHHDDSELFASFTTLRERARVVVVLESHLQEQRGDTIYGEPITNAMRQQETLDAVAALHGFYYCPQGYVEFWPFSDAEPDWEQVGVRVASLAADESLHVYAPAFHKEGHDHHNEVAELVAEYVPWERRTFYTTYRRGVPDERVTGSHEVEYDFEWVAGKLRALACYRSQIGLWPHHFINGLKEYYFAPTVPGRVEQPDRPRDRASLDPSVRRSL